MLRPNMSSVKQHAISRRVSSGHAWMASATGPSDPGYLPRRIRAASNFTSSANSESPSGVQEHVSGVRAREWRRCTRSCSAPTALKLARAHSSNTVPHRPCSSRPSNDASNDRGGRSLHLHSGARPPATRRVCSSWTRAAPPVATEPMRPSTPRASPRSCGNRRAV